MSKSTFFSRFLSAFTLTICLVFQQDAIGQNLRTEVLPADIHGIAFRGNELWQITTPTLIKRNLSTGQVEASFDAPAGVSAQAPWGTDGFQSISIAPKGDIWLTLGTQGVARFDGNNQWKIWSPQSTPSFPPGIRFYGSGIEPATGYVWIYGSVENASYCFTFDGTTWKEDADLRNLYLQKFASGPQGEFIFCSRDTLLLRQNNTWVAIPEPEEGKYNYVDNPVFDPQGHLWVKVKFAKFYRYTTLNTLPKYVTVISGNQDPYDMDFDDMGNLYATTNESGLGKWDGSNWTFLPSLAGSTQKLRTWEIEKDPLGRFWITQTFYVNNCVLTLWENGAPQKNFYYGIPQAGRLGADRVGNMWFAGDNSILVRKNLNDGSIDHFELFDLDKNEFSVQWTLLKPGAGDDIWFQTSTSKLVHFDGVAWSQFTAPPLPDYLTGYCIDSKGRLYVSGFTSDSNGNQYELKFWDPDTTTWTKVDFSIFGTWNSSFGEVSVDEADNLWFMSEEGLGKRNTSDGSLEIYPLPGGSSWLNSYFSEIQTGPGGMVYVVEGNKSGAAGSPRLLQFNGITTEWKELALPAQPVNTPLIWHADLQGRVWVAIHFNTDLVNDNPSQYWYFDDGFWNKIEGLPSGAGNIASDGKGNVYFGYYDALAQFKSAGRVEGMLSNDIDDNCQPTAPDQPLPNFKVVASDGKFQYLSLSKPDGSYRVYSGSEQVTVRAVPGNPLWRSCNPGGTALILNPDQPAHLDLLMQAELDCPHMTVDISTPLLRRCFDNAYTVRACNNGTANAEDAYVDITLPAEMEIKSASKPYTVLGAQQYRFAVGDLAVGACSVFQFVVYVDCVNTTIGQTLCVQAHVYPDTICIQTASPWKGATVLLDARCEGDSVRFLLINTGMAATSQPVNYQMLRNENLFSSGSFSLFSGQQYSVSAPADGATWRLTATQEPAHPFLPLVPSLAVEACSSATGNFDKGFVDNRPNSSGSQFEDIDCQVLIGSFDPNDKQASSVGIGENTHFVLPGTELEYHIRFQNTGTDTAFTVVVRDTLHQSLDFSTFTPGVSSHPYRLELRGNALAFIFENILLPDSNINLTGSQGFLNFSIRPRRDIPLGTVLTNSAVIYFDFNQPVITNTVWHVVDSSFQHIVSVEGPQQAPQKPQLWVFPNPTPGSFWVKIPSGSGSLEIYDAQGRLKQTLTVQDALVPVQVQDTQLPDGLYLIRFKEKNRVDSVTGKVVIRRD